MDDLTNADSSPKPSPTCPLCGGTTFRHEEGRIESRWGMSVFIFRLLICERCKFVLHFDKGPSIFKLDEISVEGIEPPTDGKSR
ncbi:MAG: hypothetical protein HY741_25365 [Chloroflexi bacterium]|nr:hypothetical protein [Chloroflexota bacterium]